MISKLPNDKVFVSLITEGSAHLEQFGRQSLCSKNNLVVYDSGSPFQWHIESTTEMIVAMFPRHMFRPILSEMKSIAARPLHSGHPLFSLLQLNLVAIMELPEAAEQGNDRLERAFGDLISSGIETAYLGNREIREISNLTERAKVFMRENIDDPNLCGEMISTHIGTSPRSLARAFAAQGSTPIKWLWDERLDLARSMLRGGAYVSQVAMLCGFSDFSHFTKSFKRKFGLTPTAWKNRRLNKSISLPSVQVALCETVPRYSGEAD